MNNLILYIFIINLLKFIVNCQNFPESPCSDIFSYMEYQDSSYGLLKVDNFNSTIQNHLTVRCTSFGDPKLQLLRDKDLSTDDLIRGKPIFFELRFQSSNKFPEIIDITSNGKTICSGKSNHILSEQKIINFRMGPVTWEEVNSSGNVPIIIDSPLPKRRLPTPSFVPSTQRTFTETTTRRPFFEETNQNFSPITSTCGSPIISIQLVVHGKSYQQEAMPWLTVIFNKKIKQFMCTGSLISRKTVLSAAHCYQYDQIFENYEVGLGVYDLNERGDGAEYRDIKNIIMHHNYVKDSVRSFSDIGIVILKQSVEYNQKIKSICLISNYNDIIDKTGVVAGWGISDDKRLDKPTYTKAEIVRKEDCLISNRAFLDVTSNTTFCAGFRDFSGPCKGDSGSGLVFKIGKMWYLGGIVSQSIYDEETTCKLDDFIIYTDATKFIDWIEKYKEE